jgi:hypothetical protein
VLEHWTRRACFIRVLLLLLLLLQLLLMLRQCKRKRALVLCTPLRLFARRRHGTNRRELCRGRYYPCQICRAAAAAAAFARVVDSAIAIITVEDFEKNRLIADNVVRVERARVRLELACRMKQALVLGLNAELGVNQPLQVLDRLPILCVLRLAFCVFDFV